jgi:hypothetical protein
MVAHILLDSPPFPPKAPVRAAVRAAWVTAGHTAKTGVEVNATATKSATCATERILAFMIFSLGAFIESTPC